MVNLDFYNQRRFYSRKALMYIIQKELQKSEVGL